MFVRLTRLAVVVLALGVGSAACGKYSISNIRALKAFQDGNAAYKKAEYKKAVELYQASVTHNPDLGFAYFFLANSYDNLYKPAKKGEPANDENLPKAVENYRMAIDKLSKSAEPKEQEIRKLAYEFLIAAYGPEKLDDFSKAEPLARELIAVDPNDPARYQTLGKLYEDQGRNEEAEAEFKKAISVKPNDGLGYQILAGFYNRRGDFDKTIEAFQQRAEREPNNPEAWHTIGSYIQDKVHRDKDLTKAEQMKYILAGIAADDKALALNSEYFEALTYKNILLRMQANLEKDPAKQKLLIQQADDYQKKALAIRDKQATAAPTTKPK